MVKSHKSAYEALPARGAQHFSKDCARLTSPFLRAVRTGANLWRFSHDFYATTCIHVFFRLRLLAPHLKSVGGRARVHPKKMPMPIMRGTVRHASHGGEPGGDFSRFPGRAPVHPRIPRDEFTSENAAIRHAAAEKERQAADLGKFALGARPECKKPIREGQGEASRTREIGRGLSRNNCTRPARPKKARAEYLKKMLNRLGATNAFVTSLPRSKTGQGSHRNFRTRARSGIILAAI
jgi:hypothetical protein